MAVGQWTNVGTTVMNNHGNDVSSRTQHNAIHSVDAPSGSNTNIENIISKHNNLDKNGNHSNGNCISKATIPIYKMVVVDAPQTDKNTTELSTVNTPIRAEDPKYQLVVVDEDIRLPSESTPGENINVEMQSEHIPSKNLPASPPTTRMKSSQESSIYQT